MFEKFNNNFQNTVTPDTNFNPYQDQYFGQNDQTTPYVYGMNQSIPKPMPGNVTEQNLYPLESSLATPYLNTPVGAPYKHGGKVKSQKTNPYPSLAEMIRQQGKGEDTILAHINPLEAEILKGIGGKGTINPKTGLPQFGFFKNPFKAIKSVLGGGAGAIIGNLIAPGIGGIIGGALGQGAQHAARGKSALAGALKGAGMGAALPSAASALGWGAGKLGANSLASSLTNYGNTNAILPALGLGGEGATSSMLGKGSGLSSLMTLGGGRGQTPNSYSALGVGAGSDTATGEDLPFMDKLIGKSKDYLSDPANLLTLGIVGSSFMNRPKKETPAKRARDEKEYQKGLMLTPEELRQKESQDLALAQMKRRIERNKFLPEERFAIDPLYVKSNTPEEYRRSGRWLNYYNNPDFSGEPLVMKKGGSVDFMEKLKNNPEIFIEMKKKHEEGLRQPVRPDIVNKLETESNLILEKNLQKNNGQINERELGIELTKLAKKLGLNGAEHKIAEEKTINQLKQYPVISAYKKGGKTNGFFEVEEMEYPSGLGRYIAGETKGQDDKIPAVLSDGEFVIPADVVSDLGDGNNDAGAKELYKFMSNIRKHKRGGKVNLPPKAKDLASYMRGK